MSKRTLKSQKTTRKSLTATPLNKLRIINRHAVGVDTSTINEAPSQLNTAEPDSSSVHRFSVVPVLKKRLVRKKHEAKN